MEKLDISLVIPVYNEQSCLEPLADAIEHALAPASISFEAVMVDDGSTDGTADVLRGLAAKRPWIRVVRFEKNCGQSAAFEAGFHAAAADIVVTLDADLQNDPADIPKILEAMKGADAVCGVRVNRRDTSWRRFCSRFANTVRRLITGDRFRDVGCSLKAMKRSYLVKLKMFAGMHRFLPILLEMEGAKVVEMPVNHKPRLSGTSKYTARNRMWRALADAFVVRWMKKRVRPYKIVKDD